MWIKSLGVEDCQRVDGGSSAGFVASIGDLGVFAFKGTHGMSDLGVCVLGFFVKQNAQSLAERLIHERKTLSPRTITFAVLAIGCL